MQAKEIKIMVISCDRLPTTSKWSSAETTGCVMYHCGPGPIHKSFRDRKIVEF
jgi:hypothetical protein